MAFLNQEGLQHLWDKIVDNLKGKANKVHSHTITDITNFAETTPNWNQNDETALDYIQNRTHYEEISRGISKTFDCTVINRRIGNDFTTYELGSEPFTVEFVNVIKTNNLFEVIFNGVEYICSVIYEPDSVTWLIGNTSLLSGTMLSPSLVDGFLSIAENKNLLVDTGEPFCIVWHDSINTIGAMYAFESGTYNVTVTPMEHVVHKLDKKFLPDTDWNASEGEAGYIKNRTHYDTISEIYPETTMALDGGSATLPSDFILELNKQYIISWNSTPYTCTAESTTIDGEAAIVVGNIGAVTGTGSATGEPFVIVYVPSYNMTLVQALDDSLTSVNLKFEGAVAVKLPYKYLPDDLYRSEIKVLLPSTDVTFTIDEDDADKVGVSTVSFTVPLKEGLTYHVYWNNEIYKCIATNVGNMIAIGSFNYGHGTGEPPFLITSSLEDNTLMINSVDKITTFANVKIEEENIVKVPEKYLPNALKNPYSLEFTGTIIDTYDGSTSKTIELIGKTGTGESAEKFNAATEASGAWSHAEGLYTVASGSSSHAEGCDTTASGNNSHAEGIHTTANGYAQHVQGKYNIEDTQNAHIVGNGDNNTSRSNAHTLDWDGNAWFAGDVYVGSTSGTNKDAGSKKLATEEYVDAANKNGLPTVSAADDGAFLRVVNGSWAAVMLPNVEDGEF